MAGNATAQSNLPPMKKSILEPQVGMIFDLYPKDENAKTIVRLLEEAFTEDKRGSRPGKWIDAIPATRPDPPPRLTPELTPHELLHDAAKVNAHWLVRTEDIGNTLTEDMGYTSDWADALEKCVTDGTETEICEFGG